MTVVAVSRSREVFKCAYADSEGLVRETRWLPGEALVRRDM